jgi:hypothetical protein
MNRLEFGASKPDLGQQRDVVPVVKERFERAENPQISASLSVTFWTFSNL